MSQSERPQDSRTGGPAAKPGDAEHMEFLRLLGACERSLQAYVLGLVGRLQDADEVLQETRVKLWTEFSKYDSERSFSAWARAIAFFEVRSFRKRCVRDRLVFSSEEVINNLSAEYERIEGELLQRHIVLDSCLEKLSHSSRNLLMLCYSGKESQREIAAQMGRSFAGLRQSLLRIRRSLYDCITQSLGRASEPS